MGAGNRAIKAQDTQRKEMSPGKLAVLFSAPAVLIIAATILAPFLMAVFLSLHNWNLKRPGRERFIGLENYTDWLTDNDFWEPLQTTFTFAFLAVVVIVVIALLIALLLNEKFPGRGLLRALLLVPLGDSLGGQRLALEVAAESRSTAC